MIVMPVARAAFTTGAIFAANASTLLVAPAHQCLSHISQITIAVLRAGKTSSNVTSRQTPLPLNASRRLRSGRRSSLAARTRHGYKHDANAISSPRVIMVPPLLSDQLYAEIH